MINLENGTQNEPERNEYDPVACLKADLEIAREEVEKIKKDLALAKKTEESYKQGKEMGMQVSAMLRGLIDGGLTEEMAYDLIKTGMHASIQTELNWR